MKLRDRVALVTGAGSGIGRAIAARFAEEGARVVVNDVVAGAGQATLAAQGPGVPPARAIIADVADSAAVARMFEEIEREYGRIDVLVNNAGIAESDPTWRATIGAKAEARMAEVARGQGVQTHWDVTQTLTDEAWRRMLAVHLDGTFFCTRAALRLMARQNAGVIINMSSIAALGGLDTVPHYSAAKAGILGFTRAVAREVASRGIRVNAICPGYIDTPMTAGMSPAMRAAALARTPLGRIGEPRDVAATALFLASDDAAFFTGQWLSPNGGLFIG